MRQETRVYLVRHGETDWNREQRLQGALDVPMNAAGLAQARRLAQRFSTLPIACVVSSPLVRAAATAAILADACRCGLVTDTRLREVDHGLWTGRTLPDIARQHPSFVSDGQLRPDAFDVSGAERLPDVTRRVSAVLTDVLGSHRGRSVAIVSHGVALGLMACAATGADPVTFHEHMPSNAGMIVLTFAQTAVHSELHA